MTQLVEIGATRYPVVREIRISIPASGLFSGTTNYPAQTLDNALKAVIEDFEIVQDKVEQIEINTILKLVCAETILEGYAVKLNSFNQLERCSATDISHIHSFIGLAKQTGNTGEVISVLEDELMTNTAWAWTPNKPVFLGSNGTLTQSTVGLLYLQQIGVAISPTQLVIRISQPLIRA